MFNIINSVEDFKNLKEGNIVKFVYAHYQILYVLGYFNYGPDESRGNFIIDTSGLKVRELTMLSSFGEMDLDIISLYINIENNNTYVIIDDGSILDPYNNDPTQIDLYVLVSF